MPCCGAFAQLRRRTASLVITEPSDSPRPTRSASLALGALLLLLLVVGSWFACGKWTETETTESERSASPDGKYVVFERRVADKIGGSLHEHRILIANADGTEERVLVDGPLAERAEPSWSPDGRSIVYVRPTGIFASDTFGQRER